MSLFDDNARVLHSLYSSIPYRDPEIFRLGRVNADETVSAATTGAETGLVWVYGEGRRRSIQVIAGAIDSGRTRGRVWVGYNPEGRRVAYAPVFDTQGILEQGAALPSFGAPPSPVEGQTSPLPTRLLSGGRVLPKTLLTLTVEAYLPANVLVNTDYDGTARIPGTANQHRWFALYLLNGAIAAIDGTAAVMASKDDLLLADAYSLIASVPSSGYPLFAISASNGQTDYSTSRYVDLRLHHGQIGGGGANTALSNLASVAVNTTLVSDTDNTDDLGTTSSFWRALYSYGNWLKTRSAPSTPAAGSLVLYAGTDKHPHAKNEDGTDYDLATASGGGFAVLASAQLGADTATISLTSISGAYKLLRLILRLRVDTAATFDVAKLQFNSDTTAGNYYRVMQYTDGTTPNTSKSNLAYIDLNVVGASASADLFTDLVIEIPFYADTHSKKNVQGKTISPTATDTEQQDTFSGGWYSTSAITQIDLNVVTAGKKFVQYSSYLLLGIGT